MRDKLVDICCEFMKLLTGYSYELKKPECKAWDRKFNTGKEMVVIESHEH